MTKSIDEWAAEACGVDVTSPSMYIGNTLKKWTIKDPVCREKVREHFSISTHRCGGEFVWNCFASFPGVENDAVMGGDTIEEAEIACITAIYEAEK